MGRYLVTGGAGFIGSHIAERLLKGGHSVKVLDNFSSGKEENLIFTKDYSLLPNRYTLIKGDIRDFNTCLNACQDVDVVFHQAALRSVPKSMERPLDYNEVNINGTVNMLEAAKQKKARRFVFASSSSVYGQTDKFPEKETDLPRPISPYALTKLAGEYYCRVYSENYGLPSVCLRYFNVFGLRQALDDEYAVVIPKFIHCLLNDQPPPIYGTGKQSRDFTYIDNVVDANLLAADISLGPNRRNRRNSKCMIFNIADGKDKTVLKLVAVLNKITDKDIKPVHLPPRPGDVFRTFADISQAKQALGYQPKIDFPEGLRRTVEWFTRGGFKQKRGN